jgi:hypothetical protein
MMLLKITLPDGQEWTTEGNVAFALAQVARGHRVEIVGQSLISQRVAAVTRVRELLALWGGDGGMPLVTVDEQDQVHALRARWSITDNELTA